MVLLSPTFTVIERHALLMRRSAFFDGVDTKKGDILLVEYFTLFLFKEDTDDLHPWIHGSGGFYVSNLTLVVTFLVDIKRRCVGHIRLAILSVGLLL